MRDWAFEHPYMTFFIILELITMASYLIGRRDAPGD